MEIQICTRPKWVVLGDFENLVLEATVLLVL